MAHDLRNLPDAYLAFWRARHFPTLTTLRRDGSPHVVPVGVTFDAETSTARVITRKQSTKVANVLAAGPDGARVAVCQVAPGGSWATLEGTAVVVTEPEEVADAVARYAERYERTPSPNPDRVLIRIAVTRAMGSVRPAA
ncbi:TIGR03618 family F420-dependent PPOX class oxidoreductase [Streptomyces sp. AV19]|uniref:pyridoxamine 5'-phosphate oxidase family protein n=1 Tax=Streptomyces sp. AV19 TaxID=2793068 RepID=UPI0018FE42D4|nr:TIGR03618 family F420-dependent PPOX class oxidoreductase [Streptomyces sp. AV19]MBH1934622.1 TIGR03618 family F420-dependent PPOX class oxidoreductase [Streptomyces sp. AV19]MDG4530841.1 TIGR03618 family F420-dependent PPOX class oxidoreductase [Streptomyces sp. AV19]